MLAKEDFMVIQALVKRGVYQRDIAQTVGVHPKTVQRAVKRGAGPDGAPPEPARPVSGPDRPPAGRGGLERGRDMA